MARYNLPPFVSTADRDLARIQVVATASHYEASGAGVSPPLVADFIRYLEGQIVIEYLPAYAPN